MPADSPGAQVDRARFRLSYRWVAAVLLGAFGFLLNGMPVPLFPGIDLVFGGIAYLIAAVALGPLPGLLAALIASLPTIWLWGHPYALVIFLLEAMVVGVLVHRYGWRPLAADTVFWALVGAPAGYLFYFHLLEVSALAGSVILLKQPLNGLLDVLAAEVLLLLPSIRAALRIPTAPRLRSSLAVVTALLAVVPVLGFGVWEGRDRWLRTLERTEQHVLLAAHAYASKLEQYVDLHTRAVRSTAEAAERTGEFNPAQLQRLVSVAHEQFLGFVDVYAADARGRTVAFDPLVNARGDSLLGLDFSDRPYYSRLRRSRETVVSDVFAGRGGADEPLVVLAHPVELADTFSGFVLGALDLKSLPKARPELAPSEQLRVADRRGLLVLDEERRYRPGDRPRPPADPAALEAIREVGEDGVVTFLQRDSKVPAGRTGQQVLAGVATIPDLGWTVWVEHPYREIEATVALSFARVLALLIATAVLSLGLSDLLARWLARPLLRVQGAAAALGRGELSARVGALPRGVPIEVTELGRGFDEMADTLAERAEELEGLGGIARSLASTLETDTLLQQITHAAARLVAADGCGVALRDGDAGMLRAAGHSLGLLEPSAGRLIPLDGSLVGWVTKTGEPVLVRDIAEDSRVFHGYIDPARIGSAICAPMVGRSGSLGALIAVRAPSARPFSTADLEMLGRLSQHAAIAVENARLLEAAQAASHAKSDFIATMSHELRTPLNAVLGHLELLQMGVHGDLNEKQEHALARVDAASRHLRGLIEEVLSFARLDAGRMQVHVQTTRLHDLLDEVAAVVEPLAARKQLRFALEPGPADEIVETDPEKVRQILINLAGNAVKFTDEGEVRVRVHAGDEIRIDVTDTGPGIRPEDRERLFQPFEQLETGLSRPHGGTGLGLYLSGRYADLVGGRIEVVSERGKGSTFTLVLPRRSPPGDPPSPPDQ